MIAGAEQELRPNVDGPLFVGTHVDGSVPIEAQLLLVVIGERLDAANLQSVAIDAADLSPLRLSVEVIGIGGILERPEAIAAVDVLPA
jgi:hypothetical protein